MISWIWRRRNQPNRDGQIRELCDRIKVLEDQLRLYATIVVAMTDEFAPVLKSHPIYQKARRVAQTRDPLNLRELEPLVRKACDDYLANNPEVKDKWASIWVAPVGHDTDDGDNEITDYALFACNPDGRGCQCQMELRVIRGDNLAGVKIETLVAMRVRASFKGIEYYDGP